MKLKTLALLFSIFLILLSCQQGGEYQLQKTIDAYYQTYQERSDFPQFLSFYDDKIILEDMMSGERKIGKEAFAEFFDWENPDFAKTDSLALIITEQVVQNNQVVTKGYFTPFRWGESHFAAMHFTTFLTFNAAGKIIKQVDWINYPSSLLDYSNRKNSNDWISQ